MSEDSNGKVDLAIVKTLLSGLKDKLAELQGSQATFLHDWPNHIRLVAKLEGRIDGVEKKLSEYIDGQRFNFTTILAVLSFIASAALVVVEMKK